MPSLFARPQTSEAAEKSATPTTNTRRRPRRSAARPLRRRKPPNVSAYAVTTHCRFPRVKWSFSPIVGSATLTIDTSRIVMKNAVPTTASAHQRRGSGSVTANGTSLEFAERREQNVVVATVADRDPNAITIRTNGEAAERQSIRDVRTVCERYRHEVGRRGKRFEAECPDFGREALPLLQDRRDFRRRLETGERERHGQRRHRSRPLAPVQVRRELPGRERVAHACAGEAERLRERADDDHAVVDQIDGRDAAVLEVRLVHEQRPRGRELAELAGRIVRPAAD